MGLRGIYHIIKGRHEDGIVLTQGGLKRKREREQAQLVREQRAELERQRLEREHADTPES